MLADKAAEKAVLAGICKYGQESYYDVADIINDKTFTVDSNGAIFRCVKHILENENAVIDIPSILSASAEVGLGNFFNRQEEAKHLRSVVEFPVDPTNVRKFATKIKKFEVCRAMWDTLEEGKRKLQNVRGDETFSSIISIGEDALFNFGIMMDDVDSEPQNIFSGVTDRLTLIGENPVEQVGISTGYGYFDAAIGGGLRRGTVNMIGARPKTGKSLLSANIGKHISCNLDIPVLYLDTEMVKENQQDRIMACITETPINSLETGKFALTPAQKKKVLDACRKMEESGKPFYYKNISGKPFEEIIAIMRRWIAKHVGFNEDGTAKDCVIIYDYLKLMEQSEVKDLSEFQALGFMMTALHNFAVKYSLPILSFVQLNRDGINVETTAAASGSDRIIWLCSNFSIYKAKSDEEMAQDGDDKGNRKIVVLASRHGKGTSSYINMNMIGEYGKIEEVGTEKFFGIEESFEIF